MKYIYTLDDQNVCRTLVLVKCRYNVNFFTGFLVTNLKKRI